MKMKNPIRHLINSYRVILNKCYTIHGFGYLALVAMLATTGGITGAFMVTPDIAVAQAPNDLKEEGVDISFAVEIHPKSSLHMETQNNDWSVPIIRDGDNLVIYIVRKLTPTKSHMISDVESGKDLWLEASQEGLEIGKNEITITEWSKLALLSSGSTLYYFSRKGSGTLKIKKQGTSFHGTANFIFKEPSYTGIPSPAETNIDWIF